MKDFFTKYKKNKTIGNISIVVISLVLALGVNLFLIDSTNIGDNLKTSIIDSQNIEEKADLYLEKNNEIFVIKNSKDIQTADNISFALNYNPENIQLEINSDLNNPTVLENVNGIKTIIINLGGKDYLKNTIFAELKVIKNSEYPENINLVNANFSSTNDEKFELTTSGITF